MRKGEFTVGENDFGAATLAPVAGEELPDVEEAVLAVMLRDNRAVPEVVRHLGLTGDRFSARQRAQTYEALVGLWQAGQPLEPMTLVNALEGAPGSGAWVGRLQTLDVQTDHASVYAGLVLDNAFSRDVGRSAVDIAGLAQSGLRRGKLEAAIKDVINATCNAYSSSWRGRVSGATLADRIRTVQALPAPVYGGLITGLTPLDERLKPLGGGDMLFLLTPTSTGKTSLALQSLRANALRGHRPALYFNELSIERLTNRLLVMESVDWHAWTTRQAHLPLPYITLDMLDAHQAAQSQWYDRILEHLHAWSRFATFIPAHDWTEQEIVSDFTALWQQGECDMVYVDYLDLVRRSGGHRSDNMSEEIGDKLAALKNGVGACKRAAGDNGIPLWVNGQTPKGFNDIARPSMDNAFGSVRPSQYASKFLTGWRERDSLGRQTGFTLFRIEKNPDGGNEGFELACRVAGTPENRAFAFYPVSRG